MNEEKFESIKGSLLNHMRTVFAEIEEGMARTHEEKFALLEDAVSSATDFDELRVVFDQWYADHAADIDLDYEVDEIWDAVVNNIETR